MTLLVNLSFKPKLSFKPNYRNQSVTSKAMQYVPTGHVQFNLLKLSQLRGHAYMLHKPRCFSSNRRNFFSIRIVSMWNSLPAETTDLSGLDKFNNSVSNMFLLKFCQVNFE